MWTMLRPALCLYIYYSLELEPLEFIKSWNFFFWQCIKNLDLKQE